MDSDDLAELKHLLSLATRPRVRQLLQNRIISLESKLAQTAPPVQPPVAVQPTIPPQPVRRAAASVSIQEYMWLENAKWVKVIIDVPSEIDMTQETHTLEFPTEREFRYMMVDDATSFACDLVIKGLKHEVDVTTSVARLNRRKRTVTLWLRKLDTTTWGDLTQRVEQPQKKSPALPEMGDDADPNASMMGLLRNMYESGDDETKRMIAKSMYEARNKGGDDSGPGAMPSRPDAFSGDGLASGLGRGFGQ